MRLLTFAALLALAACEPEVPPDDTDKPDDTDPDPIDSETDDTDDSDVDTDPPVDTDDSDVAPQDTAPTSTCLDLTDPDACTTAGCWGTFITPLPDGPSGVIAPRFLCWFEPPDRTCSEVECGYADPADGSCWEFPSSCGPVGWTPCRFEEVCGGPE